MDSKILEEFKKIDSEIRLAIANEKSILKQGMAILSIAQDKFGIEELTAFEIVDILDKVGIPTDELSLKRAFARAKNKRVRTKIDGKEYKYKIMLFGQQEIASLLLISGPQVIYIQNGQPHKARKQLEKILADLSGAIKICDKYYGERSFSILEMIPKPCKVQFLTAQASGNTSTIQNIIKDFKKEYTNFEVRKYPNPDELHDRYLISGQEAWILGHGIKDIGSKESFIIRIDKSLGADFIDMIDKNFDDRWKNSQTM